VLIEALIGVAAGDPATPGLGLNIGTLLSGIAAVTVAVGSGIGAFIRFRRATKELKFQSEIDLINSQAKINSVKSAQESADRLAEQYAALLRQNAETIDRLNSANDEQRHLYEERLTSQQVLINTLLAQILKRPK
jgi:biopolymer transport protein ExbB/TolQ